MHARLIEPHCGKNWSLQFFEIPKIEVPVSKDFPDMLTNIKNIVIRESIDIGKEFKTNPFIQGNSDDWIMVEFWTDNQKNILHACEKICETLNVDLTV